MTADTMPVRFTVQRLQRVQRCGKLLALAVVALDLDGVEAVLQGVRIVRGADGAPTVLPPVWRDPSSGKWYPAVTLPVELTAAIGAELLATFTGPGG